MCSFGLVSISVLFDDIMVFISPFIRQRILHSMVLDKTGNVFNITMVEVASRQKHFFFCFNPAHFEYSSPEPLVFRG